MTRLSGRFIHFLRIIKRSRKLFTSKGQKGRCEDPALGAGDVAMTTLMQRKPLFAPSSIIVWIFFYFFATFPSPVWAREDLSTLVKKVTPSVVVINVFNGEGRWRGGGTGFFLEEEGLLVTNRHVIDGKAKALAKLSNGEFLPVEGVLSDDVSGDLVLLTLGIKGRAFPTLRLADGEIETGQPVVVIGSPLGHEGTVTEGIVSEVKNVPNFGKIIRHTAAISKGSSGSPVLNMKGEVIGVIVGSSNIGGQSLNLAISVDRIKDLLMHRQATPQRLIELINRDEERWLALLLNGRHEELINLLKKRIQISPHNALASFYLGLALTRLSRSNEAIEAYKQAIRNEPDDSGFRYNLGVTYLKLGNHREAVEAFKQTVRIKPDDAEALLNLGFSYSALGRYKEAIRAYNQAIRIKPDFVEAHYNLGEAYLKAKKKRMCIEQYEILKNLDSEYAAKLSNLIQNGLQKRY